jgi:outer membrane lipoprotein-sorting protein
MTKMMMKALLTAALTSVGLSAWAQGGAPELRAACAAKHQPQLDAKAPAANEYRFVYAKGEYRGEQQAGQLMACTEAQYTAFLQSQDPAQLMQANPTAAGRASGK